MHAGDSCHPASPSGRRSLLQSERADDEALPLADDDNGNWRVLGSGGVSGGEPQLQEDVLQHDNVGTAESEALMRAGVPSLGVGAAAAEDAPARTQAEGAQQDPPAATTVPPRRVRPPSDRAERAGRAARAVSVADLAAVGVTLSMLRANGLPDTDAALLGMPVGERALLRCLTAVEPEVRPVKLGRFWKGMQR